MLIDQNTDKLVNGDRGVNPGFPIEKMPGFHIPPARHITGKWQRRKNDLLPDIRTVPVPSSSIRDLEYKTLAGGIAHNYNNLLMGVNGYIELMLLDTGFGHNKALLEMKQHIFSGSTKIISFLKFVRGQTGHTLGAQIEDARKVILPEGSLKAVGTREIYPGVEKETPRDLAEAAESVVGDLHRVMDGIRAVMKQVLDEIPDPHRHRDAFGKMDSLLAHGAEMISQLRHCTNGMVADLRPVRMDRLVRDTLDAFRVSNRNLGIHLDFTKKLSGILADPCQVMQMLQNLYLNAADAMPDGGDLYLSLSNIDHGHRSFEKGCSEGKMGVLLTIRDTGVGMDEETVRHILKPFFSTKGIKGRGLGLASVSRIVAAHGGVIDVDSAPGLGTTFRIFMPSHGAAVFQE